MERRRTFTTLVYSVDGMACAEAKAFERRLASLLAKKHDRRYSEMCGFVKARMSLAVVRSNTLLLRGGRAGRAARPMVKEGVVFQAIERMHGLVRSHRARPTCANGGRKPRR